MAANPIRRLYLSDGKALNPEKVGAKHQEGARKTVKAVLHTAGRRFRTITKIMLSTSVKILSKLTHSYSIEIHNKFIGEALNVMDCDSFADAMNAYKIFAVSTTKIHLPPAKLNPHHCQYQCKLLKASRRLQFNDKFLTSSPSGCSYDHKTSIWTY